MELLEELLRLEMAGWTSLCDGGGDEFYGEIMTEEGVMVLAHGFALDRARVIESLRNAPGWSGYEISEERLVPIGEDSAALTYRATAWRVEEGSDFTALMSSVYVKEGDRWRLALYQQTPVALRRS